MFPSRKPKKSVEPKNAAELKKMAELAEKQRMHKQQRKPHKPLDWNINPLSGLEPLNEDSASTTTKAFESEPLTPKAMSSTSGLVQTFNELMADDPDACEYYIDEEKIRFMQDTSKPIDKKSEALPLQKEKAPPFVPLTKDSPVAPPFVPLTKKDSPVAPQYVEIIHPVTPVSQDELIVTYSGETETIQNETEEPAGSVKKP